MNTRSASNRVVLLALALALAACVEIENVPATEVILQIDGDLEVSGQLSSLRVTVTKADGSGEAVEDHTYPLRNRGRYSLPLELTILPGASPRFRVNVIGLAVDMTSGSMRPVIEQSAITSFHAQKRVYLPIFLGQVCFENLCGESRDQVCYVTRSGNTEVGMCGEVPTREGQPDGADTQRTEPATMRGDAGVDAAGDAAWDADDGGEQTPDGESDVPETPTVSTVETGADSGDSALREAGSPPDSGVPDVGVAALWDGGDGGDAGDASDSGGQTISPAPDAGLEGPVARPACTLWVASTLTQRVPPAAVVGGGEIAFETWPTGPATRNAHFVCRTDPSGPEYPGKLVEDASSVAGASYGCYAPTPEGGVLRSERYSVLTLPPGCSTSWQPAANTLPAQAVVAGSIGGVPLVPCMAPVSRAPFPLGPGDTFEAHMSDSHLGYVRADAASRCHYEYLNVSYQVAATEERGFSVLVWR